MHTRGILLLLGILFICLNTNAQDGGLFVREQDSINRHNGLVRDNIIYRKINSAFGVIATGQTEAGNLANYGSFEPVNGEFKLNLVGPIGKFDSGRIAFFSVSAGGKLIGDNTADLFSNSKLNSGVSLSGKLHVPIHIRGITSVVYSANQEERISKTIDAFTLKQAQKRAFDYVESRDSFVVVQKENLRAHISILKDSIEKMSKKKESIKYEVADPKTRMLLSDTVLQIARSMQYMNNDVQNMEVKLIQLESGAARQAFALIKLTDSLARDNFRDSMEMTLDLKPTTLIWLSAVGNVGRKKYYTFTDSAPFSEQLKDTTFLTYSFGVELNLLNFSSRKQSLLINKHPPAHILSLGLLYLRNNNIDDLSTLELSESRKYSVSDSSHSLSKKYNVYTDTITEYTAGKIYASYYYFFGKTRNYAAHLFPDIEFRSMGKNPLNIGFGLLMAVKNKKDNAIFNVELYAKWIDVANELQLEEQTTFKRNMIGLNIGVPLNFLNTK